VHVGGQPVPVDGSTGCGKALRDELAAERTLAIGATGRPHPHVTIGTLLQLKQFE
jgi:hypothetical protein